MMKKLIRSMYVAALGCALALLATADAGPAAAAGSPAVESTPSPAAIDAAKNPTPPASAAKKRQAGKGKATVETAQPGDAGDSFWAGEVDLNGDGTAEVTEVGWDDEAKIGYIAGETIVKCKNGANATATMLVAVNGKGNVNAAPEGSGWWVVVLDAGECGAENELLYGCAFGADRKPTACGVGDIDRKKGTVTFAAAAK